METKKGSLDYRKVMVFYVKNKAWKGNIDDKFDIDTLFAIVL